MAPVRSTQLDAGLAAADVVHVLRERLADFAPEEAAERPRRHVCDASGLGNAEFARHVTVDPPDNPVDPTIGYRLVLARVDRPHRARGDTLYA